jgi:hypothetical protein
LQLESAPRIGTDGIGPPLAGGPDAAKGGLILLREKQNPAFVGTVLNARAIAAVRPERHSSAQ